MPAGAETVEIVDPSLLTKEVITQEVTVFRMGEEEIGRSIRAIDHETPAETGLIDEVAHEEAVARAQRRLSRAREDVFFDGFHGCFGLGLGGAMIGLTEKISEQDSSNIWLFRGIGGLACAVGLTGLGLAVHRVRTRVRPAKQHKEHVDSLWRVSIPDSVDGSRPTNGLA